MNQPIAFSGLSLSFILLFAGCAAQSTGVRGGTQLPGADERVSKPQIPETETMPIEMRRPSIPEPMTIPANAEISGGVGSIPGGSSPVESEISEPAPAQNIVVASLISAADRYESDGDFPRAAASIERGLRISPKDARLWQRLAKLRLEQQQLKQAELTAKKSNALARGNHVLVAENWEIIAASRRLRGDEDGAAFAAAKASQYRQ